MPHDAVAQPLDRTAAVRDRRPLDEFREVARERGGCLITPLMRQPCVARDIEEAHGGGRFSRLDPASAIVVSRTPMMFLPTFELRGRGRWRAARGRPARSGAPEGPSSVHSPISTLDMPDAACAPMTSTRHRLACGVRDPSEAIADDPEDPLHRCRGIPTIAEVSSHGTIESSSSRIRSAGDAIAPPMASRSAISRWIGQARRAADLLERLRPERRPALVRRPVHEVETRPRLVDGI